MGNRQLSICEKDKNAFITCFRALMRTVMKSILLVDDDADYLRLLKNFLMGEGLMA
jgi:hypothetical protein